jgi:hypothetical protein
MQSKGPVKHFILAFLLALAGYIVFYEAIEYRRTRNGPWRVTFTRNAAGAPAILIDQPRLAITNAQVSFVGEPLPSTNRAVTLVFDQPRPVPYSVPFGNCIFMDTTFLPGTLTFRLFGHEIEMLPRVLVLDREEHPWQSGASITLSPPAQASPAQAKP